MYSRSGGYALMVIWSPKSWWLKLKLFVLINYCSVLLLEIDALIVKNYPHKSKFCIFFSQSLYDRYDRNNLLTANLYLLSIMSNLSRFMKHRNIWWILFCQISLVIWSFVIICLPTSLTIPPPHIPHKNFLALNSLHFFLLL